MADNIVDQQQPIAPPSGISVEVANAMAESLGGHMSLPTYQPEPVQPTEPVVEPQGSEPVPAPSVPTNDAVDHFVPFREKFGFESYDDVISEIESLRQLKQQNPIIPADEQSKEILSIVAAGKLDELRTYLDTQHRIDSILTKDVDETTAADIIKLGMSLKYENLTPQEVEYKFKKQFGVPDRPIKTEYEEDSEYQARLSNWEAIAQDKKMELLIEAKLSKPTLEQAKKNIVLPKVDAQVDPDYLAYKKSLEEAEKLDQETAKMYRSFQPNQVETKIAFNDEANKINFEFQYTPDAASFASAVEVVADQDKFWGLFRKPDGSPDREKFLDAVYYAMNKEKVLTEAMNQAKNAAIKAQLPDNYSQTNKMPVQSSGEMSEFQKQMQMSLQGFMLR